jgi:hypothetical protein
MRTRPLAVALFVAFAPAALAAPARAQTTADDPTTEMARTRFKEGVAFFDKGQYEQSRAAFLQAYALKKHPAVLLNLAWASLKSGHTLEAEHYFKQFLAEGKDATDKQRADANDGLNQAHAKLGRIEIGAVGGTEVTVDGDRTGVTPLPDPILVEPGAHTVKFKGPDGATDTDSVTVLAGEKAIAHFAKPAAAPAAPPAPTPVAATPPASTGEPDQAAPPDEATKPAPQSPAKDTASTGPHTNLLSAPDNVVPVVIGGVVVVASVGLAIGVVVAKQSAQNKANATADQIRGHGGTSCNPPAPASLVGLTEACSQFVSDNNDVNTDATIGNIAVGVGAAALAATVIYWLVADRADETPQAPHSSFLKPTLTPIVGPSVGGLSLSGKF